MGKKKRNTIKIGALLFGGLFLIAAYLFFNYYNRIYASAATVNKGQQYLFIQSDWDRTDLMEHLYKTGVIKDTSSLIWLANQKKFYTLKAGKYHLKDGMSNNALVNLLRSGRQETVRLTFNNVRTIEDLASKVSKQIESDSVSIVKALRSNKLAKKYGFSTATFLTLFLPNTYDFYWNTSAEEFIKRMAKEYKKFWNKERKAKARKLNLSQSEVAILASIVQAEQMQHREERATVAGLYINRLRKKMKLQSDPTLIYAIGDFSIKRVLNKHKELKSRFNTYLYKGLPPGPINLPEASSLDAVLNYKKHNYIYMCAKADFSGYHNFSQSYTQHERFARAYQRELNKRKIMR